ncbi:hypothetical protein GQ53DRAFT_843926 [Thozetella sp. PMI_491]|nr:hypothetical protein GQ53DRAFT_843926 [Thozetella sp. PMI_491]
MEDEPRSKCFTTMYNPFATKVARGLPWTFDKFHIPLRSSTDIQVHTRPTAAAQPPLGPNPRMPSKRKRHVAQPSEERLFITAAHPDDFRLRCNQKAIRSRAMAATAKARRKRPDLAFITVALEVSTAELRDDNNAAGDGSPGSSAARVPTSIEPSSASLGKHIPRELPHLGIYAVEPDRRARELFCFMQGEASLLYRPFRHEWFAMAVLDPSAYYLCLANASLFLFQHVTSQKNLEYSASAESTRYYSMCLKQVVTRLADAWESTTEGIITTILGLVCHWSSIGRWELSIVHMDGLERVLQARGGFKGLSHFVPRFASWFDISHAAVEDAPPRFPLLAQLQSTPADAEELPHAFTSLLSHSEQLQSDFKEALVALEKVARLAVYVNKNSSRPSFWESGIESTNLLRPAAHFVLSMTRLSTQSDLTEENSYPGMLTREMVRLTLLVLLARLKEGFSLLADEMNLYMKHFLAFLPLMSRLHTTPALRIWSNMVIACSRKGPTQKQQMVEITRAMKEANITTSLEAAEVARSILWIDVLLDPGFERVCHEIEQHIVEPIVLVDLDLMNMHSG